MLVCVFFFSLVVNLFNLLSFSYGIPLSRVFIQSRLSITCYHSVIKQNYFCFFFCISFSLFLTSSVDFVFILFYFYIQLDWIDGYSYLFFFVFSRLFARLFEALYIYIFKSFITAKYKNILKWYSTEMEKNKIFHS